MKRCLLQSLILFSVCALAAGPPSFHHIAARDSSPKTGFRIGTLVRCDRIAGFRRYDPAKNNQVASGGVALIYVEPRGFKLKNKSGRFWLHLKYDWRLFTKTGTRIHVPAWETAHASDRIDRIAFQGPAREFHQTFRLPLPNSLDKGEYRLEIMVRGVNQGKQRLGNLKLIVE